MLSLDYLADLQITRAIAQFAFVPKETHLSYGSFVTYRFTNTFAIRGGYYGGTISGDNQNTTESWRQMRNLSFTSKIDEFSLNSEISLRVWKICKKPCSNSLCRNWGWVYTNLIPWQNMKAL